MDRMDCGMMSGIGLGIFFPGVRGMLAARRGALLGDKGYDADALIERLRDARIAVVIPPKSNCKDKRECDFILYKERNLIERLFGKLKQFRAIVTRYDKLARNFLGAIRLVAAVIQLN